VLLRKIEREDLNDHYLDLLDELTPSSHEVNFDEEWSAFSRNKDHHVLVVTHGNSVVGTASLFLEHKLDGRVAGHVEDVVVSKPRRGEGLGKVLIDGLIRIAIREKCYKILLNCSDKNISFYGKFGFIKIDNGMKLVM
jgi:glucosamine-phosphate N-acetyltransferase